MQIMTGYLIGNTFYHLLDYGVANLLEVQTLKHGTNLINAIGIRIFGGQPSHGGKSSGSTFGYMDDKTQNYFYVFKDDSFKVYVTTHGIFEKLLSIPQIGKTFFPRFHAFVSGFHFNAIIVGKYSETNMIILKLARIAIGLLGGLLTIIISPPIRFRFSRVGEGFMDDPPYKGTAYKTIQVVGAWRIGIIGSILTGINRDWFARFKETPHKALLGLIEIAGAVALSTLFIGHAQSNPVFGLSVCAGAFFA